MMRRGVILLLLLLPALAVGGWLALLGSQRAAEPQMRIAIRGYDPRDLLRGHYLMFQLDLRSPDGEVAGEEACLVPDSADPLRPEAAPARPGCPYPVADPRASYRYYLPQDQALTLERLLMQPEGEREEVSVLVHFRPDGRLSFSDIRVGVQGAE